VKLARFGEPGCERMAIVDQGGRLRDLSSELPDSAERPVDADSIRTLRSIRSESLPLVDSNVRIGPCIGRVGKFICVGLNYLDHIREAGATTPTEPVLFMKATSCISGPTDPVVIPPGASMVDWEVELGVVIGSAAKNVPERDALDCVAGYCVVNDISERCWQLQGTGQWVKGKSADTFGPIGPWLVTADEVPDPQTLALWLSVNDKIRQRSSTSQMLFPVRTLISYISKFMTLLPGDIISTGTPPGVGMGMKPPKFLEHGDVVKLGIDGLGEQCQSVV